MSDENQTRKERTSHLVSKIVTGLGLAGSLVAAYEGQKKNDDILMYSGLFGFAITYSLVRKSSEETNNWF